MLFQTIDSHRPIDVWYWISVVGHINSRTLFFIRISSNFRMISSFNQKIALIVTVFSENVNLKISI